MSSAKKLIVLAFCSFSLFSSFGNASGDYTEGSPDHDLETLISTYFLEINKLSPYWAPGSIQKVPNSVSKDEPIFSREFLKKRALFLAGCQTKLNDIKQNALSENKLADYFSFEEELKIQSLRYQLDISKYLVLTSMDPAGILIGFSDPDAGLFNFNSEKDYNDFLSRMAQFSSFSNQLIYQETIGISKGFIDSCESIKTSISKLKPATNDQLIQNPFYRPVLKYQKSTPLAERTDISGRYEKVIREIIIPSYQKLLSFLEARYLPICRGKSGLSELAGGAYLYKLKIADWSGLFLNPKDIAHTGFKEIARIKAEMQKIQKELNLPGPFKGFLEYIRVSPTSYFKSSDDLISKHILISGLIKDKLSSLFSRVPIYPLKFDLQTKNIYPAYYWPSQSAPFGTVFLPVGSLKTAPIYEATTLMLHEGEPGHHFQLALETEISLRRPNRFGHKTAFIEGWALYAESLGSEMGLYDDPFQRFGSLTSEMLRAVRMVVDSELHYYGWDRQQAIDFMTEYLPYDPADIVNEVDRYIKYPGQAVSYKVGQMKISSLRKKAQKVLGTKFDIKDFHSKILESGTVSFQFLDRKIDLWIQQKLNEFQE